MVLRVWTVQAGPGLKRQGCSMHTSTSTVSNVGGFVYNVVTGPNGDNLMPTYTKKQLTAMATNIASDMVASHSKGAPTFLRTCAKEAKRILTETKAVHKGRPTPCKRHSRYMAKRRPVNGCMDCLKFYNQIQFN